VLELAIDPTRLLRGRPVFDTEYLTNVAGGVGWRAVLDSPVRFHPLATDAATGAVVDLHPFLTTEADLRTALRATLGLPLVSGPAVSMGGRRLFDGGLAEAMPVHTPARQGVTHILFLRTRRADQPTTKPSWSERIFIGGYLALRSRGAIRPWATRYRRGITDERLLTALCDETPGTERVAQIRPPIGSPSVPRTSRDPALLAEAGEIGLAAALDALTAVQADTADGRNPLPNARPIAATSAAPD
jgi:predicted acylesterase/phospholipase RssA